MTGNRSRLAARATVGVVALFGSAAMVGGAATAEVSHGTGATPTVTRGAVDPMASGSPGYCAKGSGGVTVVVDFQELGGGIVVRCAAGPVVAGFTGLDALEGAGFSPTGFQRWGLAFICRIANRPAPNQALPIDGNPHYKEACIDTPPLSAYWGYWYAKDGGTWTYSQTGVMNRDAIRGGFEGWSFSLNHASGGAPPPGIAPTVPPQTPPTTPPTQQPPTHQPPTQQPPTHQPPTRQPPTHPSGSTSLPAAPTTTLPTTSPTTRTTPSTHLASGAHTPTASASPSTGAAVDPVAAGHNAAGEKVSGDLPADSTPSQGSPATAIIGLVVVAILAIGGGLAAWRRRASRE